MKPDNKNGFIASYCTNVDAIMIALGIITLLIGSLSIMASIPNKNKNKKRDFLEKLYYIFGNFYIILSYFCFVYITLSYVSYLLGY